MTTDPKYRVLLTTRYVKRDDVGQLGDDLARIVFDALNDAIPDTDDLKLALMRMRQRLNEYIAVT